MSKTIIITGPAGSGKTRLARLIASTHSSSYSTNSHSLAAPKKDADFVNLFYNHSCVIIDECTPTAIAVWRKYFEKLYKGIGKEAPAFIYTSQRPIKKAELKGAVEIDLRFILFNE